MTLEDISNPTRLLFSLFVMKPALATRRLLPILWCRALIERHSVRGVTL